MIHSQQCSQAAYELQGGIPDCNCVSIYKRLREIEYSAPVEEIQFLLDCFKVMRTIAIKAAPGKWEERDTFIDREFVKAMNEHTAQK